MFLRITHIPTSTKQYLKIKAQYKKHIFNKL
ncbi:hypothetical protein ECTW09195_3858, partial [Escherichia coli TW09195]